MRKLSECTLVLNIAGLLIVEAWRSLIIYAIIRNVFQCSINRILFIAYVNCKCDQKSIFVEEFPHGLVLWKDSIQPAICSSWAGVKGMWYTQVRAPVQPAQQAKACLICLSVHVATYIFIYSTCVPINVCRCSYKYTFVLIWKFVTVGMILFCEVFPLELKPCCFNSCFIDAL